MTRHTRLALSLTLLLVTTAFARDKKAANSQSLDEYLKRLPRLQQVAPVSSPGSLWSADSAFVDLVADTRARRVGDPVVVKLVAQTIAQASGSVSSKRDFEASSGLDALAGKINTSGVQNLFSPKTKSKLEGQAQTATESNLRSTLAGQVIATLDGGLLVVEARRSLLLNDQRETVLVRGLVRSADIGSDNTVSSSAMSNLEIELKGKGIISDATRPPNWLVRMIMKVLSF